MATNVIPFPRPHSNDDDNPPPTTPFIAALLAPLPDNEVPADSSQFLAELKADKRRPWRKAQLQVEAFEAGVKMHCHLLTYAYEFAPESAPIRSEEYHGMKAAYITLLDAIMMMPAPDRAALRWKADHLNAPGGSRGEWSEVWDADNDRLTRRAA